MINNRQQNGRRRGRGGQQPRNGSPSNPHSNNRVDNRQRGNAAQLLEKYKTLARDAQMAGDRVNTEYYLQFADHYFRVLSENRARFEEQQQNQQSRGRPRDDFSQDEEGEEDNPFTRPYGAREAAGEDGWDEDEGEATPPPAAQAQRERRDHQPRERRPNQPQGERAERESGDRLNDRDAGDRGGYRNGNGKDGERLAGDRQTGERQGGDRAGYRGRGQGGLANGARPHPEAAETAPAQAALARSEDASARIEIALPPALTLPAPMAEAAPELPMDAPVDAATADEAPAPKRRRTRKPKPEAAPAEA